MSDFVGIKYSIEMNGSFSGNKKDPVYAIVILLATMSKEFFQPYRLTNALVYLQRNGVNTNYVLPVW